MSSPRILLVDDEPDLRKIIKRGLELSGCVVEAEGNPKRVLVNFRPGRYDIAILDVGMPGMDGFELYEQLVKMDSQLKVCFLTAYDIEYFREFRGRFPKVPEKCFLRKPVGIRDLLNTVKSQLGADAA
jgi:CheY-like chemotaxis protein